MSQLYLPGGGSIDTAPKVTGSSYLATESSNITRIQGVDGEDMAVIRQLLDVWRKKYPRNLIRTGYADAKERFKDFRISVPDSIKTKVSPMIGWPAKAVTSLADLSVFEGFSIPQGQDGHGIAEIADDNQLEVDVPEAIHSAYTHSCSFITIATDPENEDRIILMPRSADWSAAIWDRVHRRISAALTISSSDKDGRIDGFNVYLPGKVYECSGRPLPWRAERFDTNYDRVTVVPFVYDKQMNRPFGRSRISRTVMAQTDIAFRTVVRMEASAEFYSVPKLWFLGADQDAFSKDTWSSLISAINAISKDEDGDLPQIQQITQASMQPHSDMLKTIAMLAASEMSVPVDEMGITLDNPSSAEAMAAAERKLTRIADRQNTSFSRALKTAMEIAVCLREHLDEAPDDLRSIRPIWAPTREISDAARADSFVKMAGVVDGYADSEVGLAKAGLTHEEIVSLQADQKRIRAQNSIDQLKARVITASQEAPNGSEQSASESGTQAGVGEAA